MAIFEFTDTTYIEAVWFVGDGESCDWMAVMFRDALKSPWRVKYRFRYYAGPDPDDPNDTKHVYELKLKDGEAVQKLFDAADFVSWMTLKNFGAGAQRWHGVIRGNMDAFAHWMQQQPFAHYRVATTEPKDVQ